MNIDAWYGIVEFNVPHTRHSIGHFGDGVNIDAAALMILIFFILFLLLLVLMILFADGY